MITLKMADQRRSDFYVVITLSLCALGLKQLLISLLFQTIPALILDLRALRSYLKPICEHELHALPNQKVTGAKDHGKYCIKARSLWYAIFCVIVYYGRSLLLSFRLESKAINFDAVVLLF